MRTPGGHDLLRMCHLNIQSLPAHINDLIGTLDTGGYHIIGLTETWLKPLISDNSVIFPGYSIVRNDRTFKRGGGVALLIVAGLRYRVIASSDGDIPGSVEYLIVEVWGAGFPKVLVSVAYRAPRSDLPDNLWETLSHLSQSFKFSFVMGDLNLNLSGRKENGGLSSDNRYLRNSAKDLGLAIVPFEDTFRVGDARSWLDIFLISDPRKLAGSHQLSTSMSHHDLIGIVFSTRVPKVPPRSFCFRDLKNIDKIGFLHELSSCSWDSLYCSDSIDLKVEMLNGFIFNTLDLFAPIRHITAKKRTAPWLTDIIRSGMREREMYLGAD